MKKKAMYVPKKPVKKPGRKGTKSSSPMMAKREEKKEKRHG